MKMSMLFLNHEVMSTKVLVSIFHGEKGTFIHPVEPVHNLVNL